LTKAARGARRGRAVQDSFFLPGAAAQSKTLSAYLQGGIVAVVAVFIAVMCEHAGMQQQFYLAIIFPIFFFIVALIAFSVLQSLNQC
jgi:hypothetical protein